MSSTMQFVENNGFFVTLSDREGWKILHRPMSRIYEALYCASVLSVCFHDCSNAIQIDLNFDFANYTHEQCR